MVDLTARPVLWALLITCAGCGDAASVPGTADAYGRNIVDVLWDTLFVAGGAGPNDTTLLSPGELEIWGERIAVLDGPNQNVRAFSSRGEFLWSLGKRGGGPGEFKNIFAMAVAPNGNLWVNDERNAKVVEVSPDGRIVREVPTRHMPVPPGPLLVLRNRVLFTTQSPAHGVIVAEPDSFGILSTGPFPWPEPLDPSLNLSMVHASDPESGTWISAFELGPGFIIGRGDSTSVHRYIQPIPWAVKSGPAVRAAGADSARYAASAVSLVDGEVYMLFGGRPRRHEHAAEPTFLIDVYTLAGEYRRSYRLPSDSWAMATADGRTFYVLTMKDEVYPVLMALRLRESSGPPDLADGARGRDTDGGRQRPPSPRTHR